MCYSAMVEQNAKKLGLRYKARIQTDLYDDLFDRRLKGEKLLINKAMEYPFVHGQTTMQEKGIGAKIRKWHELEAKRLEEALVAQKTRLENALRSLEKKETKKALEDKRIATNKIEKFISDIEKHRNLDVVTEGENRIFPLHYMSMLCLDEKGEKVIRPVRYLMRPHNKDERFDAKFNGCYNARYDSLESVPWWSDSFGKRHGIILVKKFYENVPVENYTRNFSLAKELKGRENIVLCFEPENVEYMFIPTLWDVWEKKGEPTLYSAALITDDPAPEIAKAGHDRTPIFLRESIIEDWLYAEGRSTEELKAILSKRERPLYVHNVMGAA